MTTFNDILAARQRIGKYLSLTALDYSMGLSTGTTKVYLKLENQQKQKAFKVRGALSKLSSLSDEEKTGASSPSLQATMGRGSAMQPGFWA
jgi:threonine dehydratase